MNQLLRLVLILTAWFVIGRANCALPAPANISEITATANQIIIHGSINAAGARLVEVPPQREVNLASLPVVATNLKSGPLAISIPRFDGARDRIYSGFMPVRERLADTNGLAPHFVDTFDGVSKYVEAFPTASSKKGLQVQMLDDALALGVKHAALNFNLTAMIDLQGGSNDFCWLMDGRAYCFKREYVSRMDESVKRLSDAGVVVTLILLNYRSHNPAVDRIAVHPQCSPETPHQLSAFNTVTEEGVNQYKACLEFIAERYSRPDRSCGRAVNFIVGNEVNSHWEWCNLGRASMEAFAEDYLRAVRIANTALRKYSSCARVYLSLEHHWNIRYTAGDAGKSFAGRPFLEYFSRHAKAGGDFDWNLAFHPYPENLLEPRTWNDTTATLSENTKRITFKNLEMLPRFLARPEMKYAGRMRHVILSEQGFNTVDRPEGETWQAAAYCYAYYRADHISGIDSFILHRHVDNRGELPLNLGLWRRKENSNGDPASKKLIYEVFRAADTAEWRRAFDFALPVIGIEKWDDLLPKME